jgi:anterior pharynx defective protein 1
MGLLLGIACVLTAYGPSLAIFLIALAPHAQHVLLAISTGFFYLTSILLSSILYYSTEVFRSSIAQIIYSVLLQELFRMAGVYDGRVVVLFGVV